jgi:hypothetical protein
VFKAGHGCATLPIALLGSFTASFFGAMSVTAELTIASAVWEVQELLVRLDITGLGHDLPG